MQSDPVVQTLAQVSNALEALRRDYPAEKWPLAEADEQDVAEAIKLLILELECALRRLGVDFQQDQSSAPPEP